MKKLSILITRPEPENNLSCNRVNQYGYSPVSLPMLSISPVAERKKIAFIRSQIFNINKYQYVIFVSKNAVRFGTEWINNCWPMLPEGVHWIGIGKGTTKALQEKGIPAITNPGHTSETLLKWLISVKMREKKVLIIRSEDGRPELGNQLEKRGAIVRYLSLYRRQRPDYPATTFLMLPEVDLIWITSGEGLENLNNYIEQFKPEIKMIPILTPSIRVNELAIKMGWKYAKCANGADDQSFITATEIHTENKNNR